MGRLGDSKPTRCGWLAEAAVVDTREVFFSRSRFSGAR